MCRHNYAQIHPDENCVVCFHDIFANMSYEEIINQYKECKNERKNSQPFDYDKVFEKTVKFYIDKKGYTKERANAVAEKVVLQQQQLWDEKK